jgi:hypothetical protein
MVLRYVNLLACAFLLQAGCTSMSSTMLTRDESNVSWIRYPHLKGVPITLKVPTHVKIFVYEHHFLQNALTPQGETRVTRVKLGFPVRDIGQEFIYSEKIFTVDFKRPAAGMYNLRLDMTDDQYIDKVQHDVTDKTIEEVGNAIHTLAPGGLFPTIVSDSQEVDGMLEQVTSVVAVGMFEIDASDFEEQVASFINCHLNQAHDALMVPPSVDSYHRVGFSGFEKDQDLCQGVLNPHTPDAPANRNSPRAMRPKVHR